MKRVVVGGLLAVGLGVFVAALGSATAGEAIAVVNPGFESGIEGWQKGSRGAEMVSIVTEAAFEGKMGLRIDDTDAELDPSLRSVDYPCTEGKTYRVTFKARNLAGRSVGVFLRFFSDAGNEIENTSGKSTHIEVPEEGGVWKDFQIEAKAPAFAKKIVVAVRANRVAIVKADFDNFALEQAD